MRLHQRTLNRWIFNHNTNLHTKRSTFFYDIKLYKLLVKEKFSDFFPAKLAVIVIVQLLQSHIWNNINYLRTSESSVMILIAVTSFLSILIPAAQQQTSEETPKKEDSFEAELCKDKDAGEWFRLVAGEGDNCRDVIQCTSSVSPPTHRCRRHKQFATLLAAI